MPDEAGGERIAYTVRGDAWRDDDGHWILSLFAPVEMKDQLVDGTRLTVVIPPEDLAAQIPVVDGLYAFGLFENL